MRRFHSYGPVDCEEHFCVARKELVKKCMEQMIGNPEKGGHYFTIWAPRQAGKTWLMQQVKKEIEKKYPDRFMTAHMSCQGIIMEKDMPEDTFLTKIPKLMLDGFDMDIEAPKSWEEWVLFFRKRKGLFEKPVILFIDEIDSLPLKVIDRIVTLFRDIYLNQGDYYLHGLSLIGVRAVLGVESERGSPFNIQRSLHVPNFTWKEVKDLFRQYREESGQKMESGVVQSVYDATRGQPGLVGWFGELLTETYNPGRENPIDMDVWADTFRLACVKEWNNTVLNLIKKAKGEYLNYIIEMFTRSDIPFTIDSEWCSYAYLHGIIDMETVKDLQGRKMEICRFANPFIQNRLYNALTLDLIGDRSPILALEPLDKLTDVFDKPELDLPALMERYKNYLNRLKTRGINPWKDQPRRRTDKHLAEAVGHFHLYAWLQNALGRRCSVSPEFPTGNGRVDLHLQCQDRQAVIEVKSFKDMTELENSKKQAAGYAKELMMPSITLVVFVPVDDESVLNQLSGPTVIDGIEVFVSAIGWV